MEIKSIISTEEELRKILGQPSERALKKVISSLDHHCVDFLSKSPFLVLSTANKLGSVTPRREETHLDLYTYSIIIKLSFQKDQEIVV